MKFSTAAAAALALATESMAGQFHTFGHIRRRALQPAPLGTSNGAVLANVNNQQSQQGRGALAVVQGSNGGLGRGNVVGGVRQVGQVGVNNGRINNVGLNNVGLNNAGRGAEIVVGGANQVTVGTGSAQNVIIIWMNTGGNAATSTLNQQVTPTAGSNEGARAQQTQTMTVGGKVGKKFTPDKLTDLKVGDVVVMEFHSMKHSATQSTFGEPCKKMEGGFDTGLMENANDSVVPPPRVAMQVMTEEPVWLYCTAANHCNGSGMVASLNPTAEKSQEEFQRKALESGSGGGAAPAPVPVPVGGGEAGGGAAEGGAAAGGAEGGAAEGGAAEGGAAEGGAAEGGAAEGGAAEGGAAEGGSSTGAESGSSRGGVEGAEGGESATSSARFSSSTSAFGSGSSSSSSSSSSSFGSSSNSTGIGGAEGGSTSSESSGATTGESGAEGGSTSSESGGATTGESGGSESGESATSSSGGSLNSGTATVSASGECPCVAACGGEAMATGTGTVGADGACSCAAVCEGPPLVQGMTSAALPTGVAKRRLV